MRTLILTVKEMPAVGIEAEIIKPESFAGKTIRQVEALKVYAGNRKVKLGDVFSVEGETAKNAKDQKIVVEKSGPKLKRLGESMSSGEIVIKGDAGYHLGEYMSGGKITVEGNAASWVGTTMSGGEIIVSGNAGSYIGSSSRGLNEGMRGGRIAIKGNAGTEVGVGLVGGEIIVEGSCPAFAGSYMKGGSIRLGGIGERVGYAMSGGEITVEDPSFKPPLYFKKEAEEDRYVIYGGDASFKGGGRLKVRK